MNLFDPEGDGDGDGDGGGGGKAASKRAKKNRGQNKYRPHQNFNSEVPFILLIFKKG